MIRKVGKRFFTSEICNSPDNELKNCFEIFSFNANAFSVSSKNAVPQRSKLLFRKLTSFVLLSGSAFRQGSPFVIEWVFKRNASRACQAEKSLSTSEEPLG